MGFQGFTTGFEISEDHSIQVRDFVFLIIAWCFFLGGDNWRRALKNQMPPSY
jgi:hypothetical protein